jgi:hypothetical protein
LAEEQTSALALGFSQRQRHGDISNYSNFIAVIEKCSPCSIGLMNPIESRPFFSDCERITEGMIIF